MPSVRARRGRSIAACLASLAFVLGACTGPASPAASATSTPAPSPTASPFDVAPAFREAITAADFSATMHLEATIDVGIQGTITGEMSGDASGSHALMKIDMGPLHQESETISTAGRYYTRTSPGPWLETDKPATSGNNLDTWLRSLSSITDVGVVTKGGRSLHHLVPAASEAIGPDAFGMTDPTIGDVTATVDMYAEDDGTPAAMSMDLAWTQSTAVGQVKASMTVEITFSDVGKPVSIRPPVDVWTLYRSGLGYQMGHPQTWTVKPEATGDGFYDSDGVLWFAVVPYTEGKGLSADGFRDALIDSFTPDLGQPREAPVQATLGGESAWRITWQWAGDQGEQVAVDVVAVHADLGWDVGLYTLPSVETRDVALFDKALATFAFTK